MKLSTFTKTAGYLLIIWVGYLSSEWTYIPSFHFMGISHLQPNEHTYSKCLAFTSLLVWSTLLLALWKNFWCMISLLFICWGMLNNFIDEMTNKQGVMTIGEQISLLLALLTTSILIWRHHNHQKKSI